MYTTHTRWFLPRLQCEAVRTDYGQRLLRAMVLVPELDWSWEFYQPPSPTSQDPWVLKLHIRWPSEVAFERVRAANSKVNPMRPPAPPAERVWRGNSQIG